MILDRCYGAPDHGAARLASRVTDSHSSFTETFAMHCDNLHNGDPKKLQLSVQKKHKENRHYFA
jgi:hypothetical protein